MGKKYIIELEDKPFHKEDGDFLYRVKGFNSLVFDMTGIGMLTPYTEPDLGQVRKKAYKIGYEKGYRDGVNRIGDAEDKIRKEAYDEGYQSGREDLNIVMSDVEQAKADAYLKGLNDGQGVILASTQNNAFNNGYKKCLKDIEQVRKEAYQEGKKQAKVQAELDVCHDIEKVAKENYKAGLSDAWEAARKICTNWVLSDSVLSEIFGMNKTIDDIMKETTASEAIEKIRQYEQEKEKEFKVGDEFENENGKKFVVLKMNGKEIDSYVDEYGSTYHMNVKYKVMRKTGRHFPEVDAVLEKMRGEQDG